MKYLFKDNHSERISSLYTDDILFIFLVEEIAFLRVGREITVISLRQEEETDYYISRNIFYYSDNCFIFATLMRIIAKKTLVSFYSKHADSETALEEWYAKTEEATWENFADLKKTFNSADNVGNKRIVFDIKGNSYRIVCIVLFRIKMVYIRFIGTHNDYDRLTEEEIQNV